MRQARGLVISRGPGTRSLWEILRVNGCHNRPGAGDGPELQGRLPGQDAIGRTGYNFEDYCPSVRVGLVTVAERDARFRAIIRVFPGREMLVGGEVHPRQSRRGRDQGRSSVDPRIWSVGSMISRARGSVSGARAPGA